MAANARLLTRNFRVIFDRSRQHLSQKFNIRLLSDKIIDVMSSEQPIPEYKTPQNEPPKLKRARLLYQSR